MQIDLSSAEIDSLLLNQLYGHLGCTLPDGRPYVVPVTFAYHGGAIYSFSGEGMKIEALRQNTTACFQVEQFVSEGVWQSAIIWGKYEELLGTERAEAMRILFARLEKEDGTAVSPLYYPPQSMLREQATKYMRKEGAIFYRLRITQKTGRTVRND